jgi:hypothetical protein
MKLVEVVIMTGIQCISPLESAPERTVAAKVWCAVLIEKDTVTGRIEVTPPVEARNPAVRTVLQRFGAPIANRTMSIAALPALQRPPIAVPHSPDASERPKLAARLTVVAPLPKSVDTPEASTGLPAPEAEPEEVAALEEPEAAEVKPAKKPASAKRKRSDVCTGTRKAVWYTNKDGRRKYRCRRSGSAANIY